MTTLQPNNKPPQLVHISTILLWTALALAFVLQFMHLNWEFGLVFSSLLKGLVLVFVLHIYLILGIAKGRNSARWIYLLFFIGALLIAPPSIDDFADTPMIVATEILQISAQFFAFLGLFMRSSNTWFKTSSTTAMEKIP
jgi:hypothetical protein